MSTSTAEHDSYLVENWDTETLIDFLKEQNLKLDDDDLGILRNEKITGLSFLDMTKDDFKECGLKIGPATLLAKEAKALKEKPKRAFSSYKSLSEVLAKYGIDGNGTDTIPLFSLQSYEIEDTNEHFKQCMAEILVRLKNYGTLVVDSLEAMRNEYVVAILHSAINITRDDTGKELSMRPEYEVIGEESSGRVDYAIKDVENLICITEDKPQRNVIEGFAQNIKQLESSYETNKKKRKRGDGDDYDYLYGIVTTARDWHFLLYTPGRISQGSKLPLSIEFSEDALDKKSVEYQTLCNGVKKVLSVVVGIIKDRACAEEEPDRKRVRVEGYRTKK
ncbi:hypothetical protein GLOIN_2v1587390 [Rhizophagus irregularis DAOM 181602=DAOM 197198]|uniref:Uncharacterized protein n=1 Tax=Rhizophagus irregularis (strain DAOM 181602 / DAOM 197198 / MUCL 43194) TaxID=747089 RepID=A0A2H5TRA5_RHIID|nr:hypothetical protein GLOIN_2v1587390 [Rhizophagus irregularis DAOM 181602=DAOM 197198]POG73386.1 hypothetical protein GLOIN_2v1587390 [Rhizophagus irregularis DAOM 181602=DAOM 197198]|eukprot:XP_025180252.1 hypothetical protein GLOIN_2v1587390 [Rhizophagus irregularis DAOM 181602=DAOM 197198]